jgi:FKBP-type peptidyl-prolyl cis-trans isomerase
VGQPTDTGAWVRFKYTGWVYDAEAAEGKGMQFDSSDQRGEPFVFQFGKQNVILGWESGLLGMRAGGLRRRVVPPQLAFGQKGFLSKDGKTRVPPNAMLVFEVELIDCLPPYTPSTG